PGPPRPVPDRRGTSGASAVAALASCRPCYAPDARGPDLAVRASGSAPGQGPLGSAPGVGADVDVAAEQVPRVDPSLERGEPIERLGAVRPERRGRGPVRVGLVGAQEVDVLAGLCGRLEGIVE